MSDKPSTALSKADYQKNRGDAYSDAGFKKYKKKKAKEMKAWEKAQGGVVSVQEDEGDDFTADFPPEVRHKPHTKQYFDAHGRIPGGEVHRLNIKFGHDPQRLQLERRRYLKNERQIRDNQGRLTGEKVSMAAMEPKGPRGHPAGSNAKMALLHELILSNVQELINP